MLKSFKKGVVAVALACMAMPAPTWAETIVYSFAVFENNEPVGTYKAIIQDPDAAFVKASSHKDLSVKGLFDTGGYKRVTGTQEHWQDGCLAMLDVGIYRGDNELKYFGRNRGGVFAVRTAAESIALRGCVHAEAYWSRAYMKKATRLILPEQNRIIDVTVTEGRTETILDGEVVPVYRLHVQGEGFNAYANYEAENNRWLSLEVFNGGKSAMYVRAGYEVQ